MIDYRRVGERVVDEGIDISPSLLGISASDIRQRYDRRMAIDTFFSPGTTAYASALLSHRICAEFAPYRCFVLEHNIPDARFLRYMVFCTKVASVIVLPIVMLPSDERWWSSASLDAWPFFQRFRYVRDIFCGIGCQPPLIVPLFCQKNRILYREGFLPDDIESWCLGVSDFGEDGFTHQLLSLDETVATVRDMRLDREVEDRLEPILSAADTRYNVALFRRARLAHREREQKMSGKSGISFSGPTTVHGPVTNVEGEGHEVTVTSANVSKDDLARLLDTLMSETSVLAPSVFSAYEGLSPSGELQEKVNEVMADAVRSRRYSAASIKRRFVELGISVAGSGLATVLWEAANRLSG